MPETMKKPGKRERREAEMERLEFFADLNDAVGRLRHARHLFENASDTDLIESAVYEIMSLQARYTYLLRVAKERGYQSPGVQG